MSTKTVILTTRSLTTDELKVFHQFFNLIVYDHDTMQNKQIMTNTTIDLVIIDIRNQPNRDFWAVSHDSFNKQNLVYLKSGSDRMDTEKMGIKYICKRINTDAKTQAELLASLKTVSIAKHENLAKRVVKKVFGCILNLAK